MIVNGTQYAVVYNVILILIRSQHKYAVEALHGTTKAACVEQLLAADTPPHRSTPRGSMPSEDDSDNVIP